MLWVFKRPISMRWFFWAPKTYAKNDESDFFLQFTLKYFVYLNLWFGHKVPTIYKILYMHLNMKNDY